jgi:hypothetical protein
VILADLDQQQRVIVSVVFAIIVFALLGFVVLKGYRWFVARSQRAQMRAFDGVAIYDRPSPGLVEVVFHTYSGVVVFVIQFEHRFWARPDDARLVLSRLHRFNLTWGLFAYGLLIIPVFSFGNYWAQRRRITKQSAQAVS